MLDMSISMLKAPPSFLQVYFLHIHLGKFNELVWPVCKQVGPEWYTKLSFLIRLEFPNKLINPNKFLINSLFFSGDKKFSSPWTLLYLYSIVGTFPRRTLFFIPQATCLKYCIARILFKSCQYHWSSFSPPNSWISLYLLTLISCWWYALSLLLKADIILLNKIRVYHFYHSYSIYNQLSFWVLLHR